MQENENLPGDATLETSVEPSASTLTNFFIYPGKQKNGLKDIIFEVKSKDIPEDQIRLKSEVERTLNTISILYKDHEEKFDDAFYKLISLARVGLVGQQANLRVSYEALKSFHKEIMDQEAGFVKNRHLRTLGIHSLITALIFFLTSSCFSKITLIKDDSFSSLLLLISGSPLGVWMSFASRKINMNFYELSLLEEDHLNPLMRLIFIGLLTLTFGLLLMTNVINFEIGGFSAKEFHTNAYHAFLLGLILGLSEKILPEKILDQANMMISKVK